MKRFYMLLFILIIGLCTACDADVKIRSTSKPTQTPFVATPTTPTAIITEDTPEPEDTVTPIRTQAPIPDGAEKFHSLFLYENYIYEFKNLTISKLIGDENSLLDVSPDKSRIAAINIVNYDESYINVYDFKGNNLIHTTIPTRYNRLKWIDNETILAEGHINPNSVGYLFYNMKDNSINEMFGNSLTLIPDTKHFAYFGSAPQYANYYLYVFDDKVVYNTYDEGLVLTSFAFNSQGNEVSIVVKDIDNDKQFLRVFTFNESKIELNQTHECELDFISASDVFYNDKDDICFIENGFNYIFDKVNMSIITGQPYYTPGVSPEIKIRNSVLKDIVEKEFGDVFDKVYDISWLA